MISRGRRQRSILTILAGRGLISALLLPSVALAEDVQVMIRSPSSDQAAVGTVELEAEAWPVEDVARVEFYIDGVLMGEVSSSPYRLTVDVGADSRAREVKAVAYGSGGSRAEDQLVTKEIKIDLELDLPLQQLYVTVTAADGEPPRLGRENFEVRDEGRTQEIVTFERGDVPLTSVLMVDSSLSMRGGRLEAALEGAKRFIEGMQSLDETKLMLFSDRLLHGTPFTRFSAILTAGLGTVRAAGGTAVNDFLYLALKELEARQGRRVVIILSDGVDVQSSLAMEEVLWKVRHSQALIYWLRLHDEGKTLLEGRELVPQTSWWRDAEEHRDEFRKLSEAVKASGGRVADLHSLDEIGPAFSDILKELRGQFVLGYYPTDLRKDGKWRRVRVRVKGAGTGFAVRTREGYVDF